MEGIHPKTRALLIALLIALLYPQAADAETAGQIRSLIDQTLDSQQPKLRNAATRALDALDPLKVAAALQAPDQWSRDSPVGRLTGTIQADNHSNPFILRVPEEYTPDRAWPLHISLHGGNRAPTNNCDEHWKEGLVDKGVILLCPSTRGGNWWHPWGETSILKGLRLVTTRYHVDPTRITIDGASLGGRGTWQMASVHPWLWKAAVPRCGPLPSPPEMLLNIEKLPIYLIHGALDHLVGVEKSRFARNILRNGGYPIRYDELPDVGHSFISQRNPQVADWLLAQPPRHTTAAFTYRLAPRREPPPRIHWLRFDWGHARGQEGTITASLLSADQCDRALYEPCPDFNRVTLESTLHADAVTVLLPEGLWAPDKPVQVKYNGQVVFDGHVEPSTQAVLQSWRDYRSTASLIIPWAVQIDLKPLNSALPTRPQLNQKNNKNNKNGTSAHNPATHATWHQKTTKKKQQTRITQVKARWHKPAPKPRQEHNRR